MRNVIAGIAASQLIANARSEQINATGTPLLPGTIDPDEPREAQAKKSDENEGDEVSQVACSLGPCADNIQPVGRP